MTNKKIIEEFEGIWGNQLKNTPMAKELKSFIFRLLKEQKAEFKKVVEIEFEEKFWHGGIADYIIDGERLSVQAGKKIQDFFLKAIKKL